MNIKEVLNKYVAEDNYDMVYYVSMLYQIYQDNPSVAKSILKELKDQRSNLKLIASENYSSINIQASLGNLLNDKYAEGFPFHRFYAGCDNIDDIESLGCELACKLFGCEHAYLQAHSGADANLTAYWAILNHKVQKPMLEELGEKNVSNLSREDWDKIRYACGNQKLLGLNYYSGGHLTHGYRQNVSAQMFDSYSYDVDEETGLLNYNKIEELAMKIKPLILLCGYSAYPRKIDFKRMRQIADRCNCVLMCDMAHFSGLVAGKVFTGDYNPIPYCDVVTSTTHKTLRGCRGGLILCKQEYAESVDKGCPLVLGGQLPNMVAGKVLALTECLKDDFVVYAHKIVDNAQSLAKYLMKNGIKLSTNGTDNHLMLIDVRPFNLNGRQAEISLRKCGITLNRNALPFDTNGAWYTSGLRIGTPAITTLGMGDSEMKEIADIIYGVLSVTKPALKEDGSIDKAKVIIEDKYINCYKNKVQNLLNKFVLYKNIYLKDLEELFV